MRNPIYRSWSLALALVLALTLIPSTAHAEVVIDTGYRGQIPLGYLVEVVSRVTPTSDYGSATVLISVKHFGNSPIFRVDGTLAQPGWRCDSVQCTFDWTVVNDGSLPAEGATLSIWVAPIQKAGTYGFINYTQRAFDGDGKLTWEVNDAGSIEIGWMPPPGSVGN